MAPVRDPVCLMALEPTRAAAMADHDGRAYYFCSERCRDIFLATPGRFVSNVAAARLSVGVMGSAAEDAPADVEERAMRLGDAIAKRNLVLITGACPGLPYACARGAQGAGGLSVGISPALSLEEHVHKYLSPADAFDVMIYTGSGLMGREVTNIRSSDMVVLVGGRSGTLGEFAIAYDEGKLIGVLEDSGGITGKIPDLVAAIGKETGARLIYERDPVRLVDRLLEAYRTEHFRRPSCWCSERIAASG